MKRNQDGILQGRRVAVVISGGIAAYKTAFAVSSLVSLGAEVDVAMTSNATEFVGTKTFESLTGKTVYTDMFNSGYSGRVEHVGRARSVDLVLVAPATANLLAKMACGIADDAVSTLLLATEAPIIAAPAMNDGMWRNPATRRNIETLSSRISILEPGTGFLAEGYESVGRMAEPSVLVDAVLDALCCPA